MKTPVTQFDPDADNFWDVFEKASLEQKAETFLAVLDSGKMDDGFAFDMLDSIVNILPEGADHHALYAGLVSQLHQKAPEAYKEECKYFHRSLISFAIEDDQWAAIPTLLDVFRNETDLDAYYPIVYQMAYHGLEKVIIPVMVETLPKVKTASELVEWAAGEFAGEISRLMLWDYLNSSDTPSPTDPAFLAATAPFVNWKKGWLERCIPRLTAKSPSAWQPADFASSLGADQWQKNLQNLLTEFVADQRQADIPFGRVDMAWQQIEIALTRQAGISQTSHERSYKPKKQKKLGNASLIPTFATLDKSLTDLTPFLGARPYHLAATLELLPAYLGFIKRLGLVTEAEVNREFQKMHPLVENIANPLKYYGADNRCIANVKSAWKIKKI